MPTGALVFNKSTQLHVLLRGVASASIRYCIYCMYSKFFGQELSERFDLKSLAMWTTSDPQVVQGQHCTVALQYSATRKGLAQTKM